MLTIRMWASATSLAFHPNFLKIKNDFKINMAKLFLTFLLLSAYIPMMSNVSALLLEDVKK